jgi:hypothetical protein
MNIGQSLNNNEKSDIVSFLMNRLAQRIAFSFQVELPESADFRAFMSSYDESASNSNSQNGNDTVLDAQTAALLKNLQNISLDEKDTLKTSEMDKIKFLMQLKEAFSKGDIFKLKNDFNQEDIKFLKTMVENPSMMLQSINPQNCQMTFAIPDMGGGVSYKSFDFSKGLSNLIEYAQKSQKPVRINFDEDSSVILKISKEGKLSAEFVSNNAAMEFILRNNIPNLRNKMDKEGLPYDNISYKEDDSNNKKEKDKKGD